VITAAEAELLFILIRPARAGLSGWVSNQDQTVINSLREAGYAEVRIVSFETRVRAFVITASGRRALADWILDGWVP